MIPNRMGLPRKGRNHRSTVGRECNALDRCEWILQEDIQASSCFGLSHRPTLTVGADRPRWVLISLGEHCLLPVRRSIYVSMKPHVLCQNARKVINGTRSDAV